MDIALVVVHHGALLTLAGLWGGSVAWTARDARGRLRRLEHVRAVALLALALPGAGVLLYLCLRPAESALERRERRALRRLLEAELHAAERCLLCRTEVRPEYRCCPGCGEELGAPCAGCGAPLRIGWQACPRCEAPAIAPSRLHAVA